MISGTVSPATTWSITSTLYGSHVIINTAKTDVKIRPARPCPDLSILAPFEFPNWQRDIFRECVTTLVSFRPGDYLGETNIELKAPSLHKKHSEWRRFEGNIISPRIMILKTQDSLNLAFYRVQNCLRCWSRYWRIFTWNLIFANFNLQITNVCIWKGWCRFRTKSEFIGPDTIELVI